MKIGPEQIHELVQAVMVVRDMANESKPGRGRRLRMLLWGILRDGSPRWNAAEMSRYLEGLGQNLSGPGVRLRQKSLAIVQRVVEGEWPNLPKMRKLYADS